MQRFLLGDSDDILLRKGWFLPSGHRPLDLWKQTGYRIRDGRRKENVFYFHGFGKNLKFQKISGKSHSQAASFLGSLFFKCLHFLPQRWSGVLAFQTKLTPYGSLRWVIFQSSSLHQLCCFPKSAAKWEVQSLAEDVSYLESALDKDASCAALLQDMWREADLVQCQGRGTRKLSEESKMKVEGKWSKWVIK